MNSHWRFHRGEVLGFVPPPDAPPLPSCTAAVCSANFDDSRWRAVDLPHDAILRPGSATAAPRAGDVRLTARAPGLGAARIELRVVS